MMIDSKIELPPKVEEGQKDRVRTEVLKYKCCKTKNCSVTCCIQCHNLFHISCSNRNTTHIETEAGKIICSQECKRRYDNNIEELQRLNDEFKKLKKLLTRRDFEIENLKQENENEILALNKEINRMEDEIRGKDQHIQKERRRTLDLTDLALVEEENLLSEINSLKQTLKKQEQQIINLRQKNETLQKEMDVLKVAFDAEKKKWSSQITTLRTENTAYLNDNKDKEIKLEKLLQEKALLMDNMKDYQLPAVIDVCSKSTQTPIRQSTNLEVQTDLDLPILGPSLAQEMEEVRSSSTDKQMSASKSAKSSSRNAGVQTILTCLGNNSGLIHKVQPSDQPNKSSQLPFSSGVRRLLIIGSYFSVKNFPSLLKYQNRLSIDINCQFCMEPLTLQNMAEKGYHLSRSFSTEDYVILFMDSRSAQERSVLTDNAVKGMILDLYKNTNLIIVGASQIMSRQKLKQSVYEYNILIKKHIHTVENGVAYISLDSLIPDHMLIAPNYLLHYKSKKNLANFIYREYLNPTHKHKPKLTFEQRLEKLLGGKQDDWQPKITTFPKGYPRPADALRKTSVPTVKLDSPLPTNTQKNFYNRNLKSIEVG